MKNYHATNTNYFEEYRHTGLHKNYNINQLKQNKSTLSAKFLSHNSALIFGIVRHCSTKPLQVSLLILMYSI